MTNADKVRAMSEEELAWAIMGAYLAEGCIQFCQNKKECEMALDADEDIPDSKCVECLIEWLRQPVEGGLK